MTDVLTWTVERRELAERAELLRKELAEIDVEVARLEAAEVVFGQWAEATDGGRVHQASWSRSRSRSRCRGGPGAGGMRLVPDRLTGWGWRSWPRSYRRVVEIVTDAGGPMMAKDVARMLGRELAPGKVEPVRGQLRKLADRGWMLEDRCGPLPATLTGRTAADRPISAVTRGPPAGVGVCVTKNQPAEGAQHAVYQVRLPVSKRTLDLVGGLIRRERNRLSTRWRKVTPGTQAVIVLAVLRHDQRLADMAGGNAVSASTVRRWVMEVIRPAVRPRPAPGPRAEEDRPWRRGRGPAGRHPDPHPAPHRERTTGKNYSGKHKAHGLLFLALTDEKGNLIWISRPRSRAGPARSPPPATTRSPDTCARPASAPWPTSASSAWTTTPTTTR